MKGKHTPSTVQPVTPAAAVAAERVRVQIVHACKSTQATTNACTHAAYAKGHYPGSRLLHATSAMATQTPEVSLKNLKNADSANTWAMPCLAAGVLAPN